MELRQLRSFVRVVELNSMGRAALEMGVATSTLSQQISALESELSTRLLQRRSTGVQPTEAGLDFWHQAQVILRQVNTATAVAQKGRLSGEVNVGLTVTTATALALPLIRAMRERYPTVKIRITEGLTTNLQAMLDARRLDLAVLFESAFGSRWSVTPLVQEQLYLVGRPDIEDWPALDNGEEIDVCRARNVPLILPGPNHTLRTLVDTGFRLEGFTPNVVLEIEGAYTLMRAVRAGEGATIQPGSLLPAPEFDAASAAKQQDDLHILPIKGRHMIRRSVLASLSDDELSPAGLATRVTLTRTVRQLVTSGQWRGAALPGQVGAGGQ